MALGTISKHSPNPDHVSGNLKVRFRKIVMPASYTTTGDALVAADFGLRKLLNVVVGNAINDQGAGDSTKSLVLRYDHTNSKLQAFFSAGSGAAPVEASGDLSTYHCRAVAWGY